MQRVLSLFCGRLARTSIWLFVANLLTGILGYVYQIIMGRMLSTSEYGLLSAMVALGLIVTLPLSVAVVVLTRKFAEYQAHNAIGRISDLWRSANVWFRNCGLAAGLVFLFTAPGIQDYLEATTIWPIYLIGLWVLIPFLWSASSALLQGVQEFVWYGFGTSFGIVVRLVSAVVLVWAGLGLNGALAALVLSSLVGGALYTHGSKEFWSQHPIKGRHCFTAKDIYPIVAATVTFTILFQMDMVLVKHYFDPHEAGIYAAASTLGKTIIHLPAAFVITLLPMVVNNDAKGESSATLLIQSVLLVGLIGGGGSLLFYAVPELIIQVLYGKEYVGAAGVLKYYGFAMLPISFVMLAEHFLIAKGRVLFAYLFLLIAPIEMVLIHFFHASLLDVVKIMLGCGVILMILGYLVLWVEYRKSGITDAG